MKKSLLSLGIVLFAIMFFAFSQGTMAQSVSTYRGTQTCAMCHPDKATSLATTLHSKIHLPATSANVRPAWTGSVNMGASYTNASVALVMNGSIYQITLTPAIGTPVTYDVTFTYGYGFKQRYLVKIENSYYIPPIQYNLNKYLDNSSGTWATYNPQKWFNADGTLKSFNNTFRKNSWDKNCSNCHITGGKVTRTITGTDTAWVSTWANNSSNLNMTVGCESCHGPGSTHATTNDPLDIYGPTVLANEPLARQQEVCGQCHSRAASTAHAYEFPWNEATDNSYYPGQILADFYTNWPSFLNINGGPGVWPDGITPRQHHQQWQDMSYSKHKDVMSCYSACHDPHTVGIASHQLQQNNDNNDICLQCHSNFGSIGNPDITAITAHTKHSYDPMNLNGTGGASRCTKCHMAKTAVTAKAYDIHAHNWKVIKPSQTIAYFGVTTPTLGMINSCAASCHRNATGTIATLGVGTDATLTNWNETTDQLLADTLDRWFNRQVWVTSNIAGTVTYDSNTFLGGIILNLLSGTTQVATTTTDVNGTFSFSSIANGTYFLEALTSKPWGGVTANDALKMKRHIAGLEVITNPTRLAAADVNNNNYVTGIDVLKVLRRIVGFDNSFARPDWIFTGNDIVVNGSVLTQNLDAICAGDVDGSNTPTALLRQTSVSLKYNSEMKVNINETFELPVTVSKNAEVGAMQLFLNYPAGIVDVVSVSIASSNEELMFNAENGQLRIVFASLNSLKLNANDAIITVTMKAVNSFVGNVKLDIQNESQVSDATGNILTGVNLSSATVEISDAVGIVSNKTENTYSLYPTLTRDNVYINSTKDVTINVFNLVGELVLSTNNSKSNVVSLSKKGVYLFELTIENKVSYQKVVVQ